MKKTLHFILWWPAYFIDKSLWIQFNEFIEFDENIMEKPDCYHNLHIEQFKITKHTSGDGPFLLVDLSFP